jgi:hypothetical protein
MSKAQHMFSLRLIAFTEHFDFGDVLSLSSAYAFDTWLHFGLGFVSINLERR